MISRPGNGDGQYARQKRAAVLQYRCRRLAEAEGRAVPLADLLVYSAAEAIAVLRLDHLHRGDIGGAYDALMRLGKAQALRPVVYCRRRVWPRAEILRFLEAKMEAAAPAVY